MRSQRRRRRMRRKGKNKTARAIIIVILVLVLAVVLTVMLGNYLKEKAASTRPGPDDTTDPPETTAPPIVDDPKPSNTVEAGYIDLSVSDGNEKTAEGVAEEFFALSYTAASFSLRDGDGSLLYTSQVATTLGQKSASSLDIEKLVELLSERDIYTVGCFDSVAFSDSVSSEMYDVVFSYESALIKELFEMGIDEILITSPIVDKDNLADVTGYVTSLKAMLPEGCTVGLCLPYTAFEDADITATAKEMSLLTSLIAIDMRGFSGEDIYALTDTFVKNAEFYITRYNMRLILPSADPSMLTRQIDALMANAIYNWQIIK